LACWDTQRLEVIDAASGTRLLRLESPIEIPNPSAAQNRCAVWSADGSWLAASGDYRQIHVWRGDTGQLIQTLSGPSTEVLSVAISSSGELVAASSWDDTTQLWEVATGRRLVSVPGVARNLAFSRDGRHLGPGRVGTATNCVIEIVRPAGFRRLAPPVPEVGVKSVHTLEFSPDGSLAVSAGADGVMLWDCRRNCFLATVPTPGACSALFDPDGNALLISAEGELSRWPLRLQDEPDHRILSIGPREEIGPGGQIWEFAALAPQSAKLAVAPWASRALILNLRDPRDFVQVEQVHTNGNHVGLSPDGRFVATGTWRGKNVRISDARTGKLLHEHPTATHAPVEFSPDGRRRIGDGCWRPEYNASRYCATVSGGSVNTASGEAALGGGAISNAHGYRATAGVA